ncbi:MAG TPA: DUF169 domain-containing protein [Bryobacteraceae bacterium]|nr:DUF169 domain-containing protein [Bryobacteraceae bacterium]
MPDYQKLEGQFREILGLKQRPVAVSFARERPERVEKFAGAEPSGCSFWRLAARGRVFYTEPADHYNCPIGAHTHKIELPAGRAHELPDILRTMTGLGYLKMEEVPGIPVLSETPRFILYAPLSETPADPDVVLLAAVPGRLMLLQEAAIRAGAGPNLPLLARPTCIAIPAAMSGGVVTSAGCIGNRVYTDLAEDELYSAIPGRALESVAGALDTIATANAALAEYHRSRRDKLATA